MTDFKAKMHQIRFRLGLRPRPHWGSLQHSPDPLAGFDGQLRGRRRGWAGEEEGKGREGEVEGGPQVTVEPGPLRALLRHCSSVFWIGGDLNLPDICWDRATITGMQYSKTLSEQFLQLTEDLNMEQVVTFPTHKDVTLDPFLTNRPSLVSRLGDHEIVLIISEISAKRQKPVKRKIHLWKKADLDAMKNEIAVFNVQFHARFSTESSIEAMWGYVKSKLLKLWTRLFHRKLPP